MLSSPNYSGGAHTEARGSHRLIPESIRLLPT